MTPDLLSVYGLDDSDPIFWQMPWRRLQALISALRNYPDSILSRVDLT